VVDAIAFDPLSAEFAADPYSTYRALREADKPWLLSRFEDVKTIATNPKMVRSLDGLESTEAACERQRRANWHDMPYHERVVQFSLLDSDGDVHRRLRKQVFGAFTSQALAGLEPSIEGFVEARLDRIADRRAS